MTGVDFTVAAIFIALIGSHALAALVTGFMSRGETQVRIKLSEAELRRDLESDLSTIRESLRDERERGDRLAGLLGEERATSAKLGRELREARSLIESLQRQLAEAVSNVAILNREALVLVKRVRVLEGVPKEAL